MASKRLIDDPPSAETRGESDLETQEEDEIIKETSGYENGEKSYTDEELESPSRNDSRLSSPKFVKRENSGFVSDSDSEKTQSSPSASAFTIKPILRKPFSGNSKSNQNLHKSGLDSASVTPVRSGVKRPADSILRKTESNKKKKTLNCDEEEGKKASGCGINRVWSENDEITLLQGMIDFQSTKGSDPFTDMNLFHEFIKKNLSFDVSKNQLIDKIRRLKKKYSNNTEKGGNGEDPIFCKSHEHLSFELSKKIWCNGTKRKPRKQSIKASNSVSTNMPAQDLVASKKKVETVAETTNIDNKVVTDEFLSDYPWLKGSFQSDNVKLWSDGIICLVKERMPFIGSDKAKELDEKWRKLSENELELYLKKVELVREQCKLTLDSMGTTKI